MRDFLEVSRRYLLGPLCLAMMSLAYAEDTSAPSQGAMVSANGEAKFVSKIESRFAAFAGSEANAESLALGLRQGQPVTLASTGADGQVTTTTFTPSTRPMGHGNVVHALSLAQAQLAAQGITQPTPEQIKVALAGGTITTGTGATAQTTTYQGILQLRSQGMGWGKIAHTIGVKPGRATLNATAGATTAPGAGVVTAAGTPAGSMIMHGRGHGEHASAAGASSSAVVTAGSAPAGREGHGGSDSAGRGRGHK